MKIETSYFELYIVDNRNFINLLIANHSTKKVKTNYSISQIWTITEEEKKLDSMQPTDFPLIKKLDNQVQLPQYFEVLTRSSNYGVKMEDLDQLQFDLEKLLSTCILRKEILSLRNDTTNLDQKMEATPGKDACNQKQQSLRHKSVHQKYKYPYPQENKFGRIKSRPSVNNSFIHSPATTRIGTAAENNIVDSFWQFTELYVKDITESDLGVRNLFLQIYLNLVIDKLIQDSKRRIYTRRSQGDNKCLWKCPRLQQCVHNGEVLQINSNHGRTPAKTKEQKISHNAISLEIEKCVRELTGISKNNIAQLDKLRNEVIKDLHSQQMEMFMCQSSNHNN